MRIEEYGAYGGSEGLCDSGAEGVDGAGPDGREDAHGEEDNHQRPQGEMLAGVDVPAGDELGLAAEATVEDTLDHPEHVGGGEDDAAGGEGGPAGVAGLHHAGEDQELADEAVEHRQADDG